MDDAHWDRVERFLTDVLIAPDPALDGALGRSHDAGLPPHQVTALEGKLLHLLARICGARDVLEIGTLAGYSTIWLARALPPDGRVVTLEADPGHAEVARANLEAAGVAAMVDLRVGAALDTLPQLAQEGAGPFDLVFVDADKPNNPAYLRWALRLTAPGSVIVADNVVRSGAVAAAGDDASAAGAREFLALAAAEPRLVTTALQTVGSKGHDGFALSLVVE